MIHNMKPHHRQNQQVSENHTHLELSSTSISRIADCMTFRPYTVTADTTVNELLQLFEVHNYDCVPVVERDGTFLGILTDGDVLRAFETVQNSGDALLLKLPARQLMNPNPVTAHAGETAVEGLQKMSAHRLRWLPVIEADALLGLVTYEQLESRLVAPVTMEQAAVTAGMNSQDAHDWLCRT